MYREMMLAASSPTGPAFDGAQINSGQRAAPGAIERVRIDPDTLEPRFKVIGCELWSDDPGFATAMPACGVTGICGSGILSALAAMVETGAVDTSGRMREDGPGVERRGEELLFYLAPPDSGNPEGVAITQNDVREIQKAKGAIRAGVDALLAEAGIGHGDLKEVVLADDPAEYGTEVLRPNPRVLGPRLGKDVKGLDGRGRKTERQVVQHDGIFGAADEQRRDLDALAPDLVHPAVQPDDHHEEDECRHKQRGREDEQDEDHRAVACKHPGKGRARLRENLQKLDLVAGCQRVVLDEDAFDPRIESVGVGKRQKEQDGGQREDGDDRGDPPEDDAVAGA